MKLYFAPINLLGNNVYRHLLLKHGADYVFSELILVRQLDKEIQNDKLKVFDEDLDRTIFQIGVSSTDEIDIAFEKVIPLGPKEINLNMGCPQSSMTDVCGGLLFDEKKMDELTQYFALKCKENKILSSVKVRLGTSPNNVRIDKYLDIFEKNGINKVYIHARTLRHPYEKPVIYEPLMILKNYKLKIIINGDIDGFRSYENIIEEINCDGVMIGRAALSNPFIFDQIKSKENNDVGPYDPIKKDPELITKGQSVYMSEKKEKFISEYIELAKNEKIRKQLAIGNVKYLSKGVTGSKKIVQNFMNSF